MTIVLSLSSCQQEATLNGKPTAIIAENGASLNENVIDSCDYIYHRLGMDNSLLTHKGNCKNCRAWQRQLISQSVKEYLSTSQNSSVDTLKIIQDILRSRLR